VQEKKSNGQLLSLAEVPAGRYCIVALEPDFICGRLRRLGVKAGDTVQVIKPGPGPVIFLKGNMRIGIGWGLACRILVKPVEENRENL